MADRWRCLKPSSFVSYIVPHTTHTALPPAHPYSPHVHVLSQFDEGLIRNQILRSYDTVNYTVNDAAGNMAGNSAGNATEGKPMGPAGFW